MKIEKIEAIPVTYPEPNDHGAMRHLCLVRLTTSDGVVGWGESITQWPEASRATKAVIEGMADLLVGRSVLHNERLWRDLKAHAWWYGYRGGIASNAVAALDIAMWDAKGRSLGVSVLDLLGGPAHDELPALASCHAFKPEIADLVDDMASWMQTGVTGVKVGFGKKGDARLGYDRRRDVDFVRALREALGPDRDIMIDLGIAIRWDVATAVERTRAFEEYDIAWIEEPLGAWDPEGYATLRRKTSTRIAYGEREWDVDGYESVLATGTVDVVGIDPGRVEGITGFKLVANRVAAYRRQANAHAWSSAIVTAASLALSLNSPACRLLEVKPLPNPMQDELVAEPIRHSAGVYRPLPGPGLGIDVLDHVVERYRADR